MNPEQQRSIELFRAVEQEYDALQQKVAAQRPVTVQEWAGLAAAVQNAAPDICIMEHRLACGFYASEARMRGAYHPSIPDVHVESIPPRYPETSMGSAMLRF
jgi:hypothetical protein